MHVDGGSRPSQGAKQKVIGRRIFTIEVVYCYRNEIDRNRVAVVATNVVIK